jgi:hypothetical protein
MNRDNSLECGGFWSAGSFGVRRLDAALVRGGLTPLSVQKCS